MVQSVSITEIAALVWQHYGLQVEVTPLSGYDELNFLLIGAAGDKYLCKLAGEEQGTHFLEAQVSIMDYLSKSQLAGKFQQVLRNRHGEALTSLVMGTTLVYLRIHTFLPGTFWVDHKAHSTQQQYNLGCFLGSMDVALVGFNHPAMHRKYYWDINHALDARKYLMHIQSHERRRIAGYFLLQFEMEVVPHLHSLRTAPIHNDANDYNVLVEGEEISGLIDFGDMVHSSLINNLAVACTYAMLHHHTPLTAAVQVVKGYHSVLPLTTQEVGLLYYLTAARLCISVTQSAAYATEGSENSFHFVTEAAAWKLLNQLIAINPLAAQDAFRQACGFSSLIKREDTYAPLLAQRTQHIGRNLSISYKRPLKIVRGALQYLYDDKGDTYIDCVNNVSHVGHCHPVVVKAMQQQLATLNTNTRYLHDDLGAFAEMLTATLPKTLQVCYFTNSGSEANDLAIRMSRHYTKQQDVIVLDHAYHGTSTVAIGLSPYKFDGRGGFAKPAHTHKAINPDLYRGPYRYDDPAAGVKYAADVQRIIQQLTTAGKGVAAFICETLLGVGGQMPLPPQYLREVYQHIRAAGGVCIADEVQVGFGRVGSKCWGFELQEVTPDIVVLGKPIGNGHPLAAVVTTSAIAEAFNNGMEYFNTFGGNPVSMATGIAVLKVIQAEEMQAHAGEVGTYFLAALEKLKTIHPIIGDVRGHGLFIGAELVRSRETLEPAVPEIDIVVEKMRDRGFLLSTDGPLHNVLKIKPPMVFTKANTDDLITHLDAVFRELV